MLPINLKPLAPSFQERKKIYCEFPRTGRGRRSGKPNHSLTIKGIYQTSISTAGVQWMLMALNKPVPNPSSLQLNKVSTILRSVNDQDIIDCLENGGY